jgi:hypothetical protein
LRIVPSIADEDCAQNLNPTAELERMFTFAVPVADPALKEWLPVYSPR